MTLSTPGNDGNEFDMDAASASLGEDLFGASPDAADHADDDGIDLQVDLPADGGDDAAAAADPATADPAAPAAPASPALEVPKTWRSEAAAKWATIDPQVQAEILKREEDIFKGLEGYKADAGLGRQFQQVVAPYQQIFQQSGINPMQQVSELMRAHVALATGTPEQKQQFFQRLAQDYGVQLGGDAPYVDPQVAGLQKQLSDLQSRLMGRERQEATTMQENLQREIDTFAADPKHPHFDEVASDIAGLIRSGAAKDLADAYEKAVWANPVTRAKEQARLTAESDAKRAADAAAKAEAAKKAVGANVKSKAKAASAAAPRGSIDDTLSAALTAIRSRA